MFSSMQFQNNINVSKLITKLDIIQEFSSSPSTYTTPSTFRQSPNTHSFTFTHTNTMQAATAAGAPIPIHTLLKIHQLYTRIRLASISVVPYIYKLLHQTAVFYKLTHLFTTTESSLAATLLPTTPNPPTPFHSFTVFIFETSSTRFP